LPIRLLLEFLIMKIRSIALVACALLLSLSFTFAQAPANDNFATPTVIAGNPANGQLVTNSTNANATREANEPNHAGIPGDASIWFQWTASSTAPVVIDLAGSAFDTVMGVYTGASLDTLNTVIFNDDGDGDVGVAVPSKAAFIANSGTTYLIAVDGFPVDNITPTGAITIGISLAASPSNDSFAMAIDLGSGVPVRRSGDSQIDATIEPGEPGHANVLGFGSTWYTWTADADGAVEINSSGSTDNPVILVVYSGDALGNLVEIDQAFPGRNALIAATSGTTYRIAIFGAYAGGTQIRGDASVNIFNADAIPITGFPFGSDWEWLHPLDAIDPAVADADFNTTWNNQSAGYDGPPFQAAAPGPLGYGGLGSAIIQTNIGTPAGDRYGAYFVRDFNLSAPVDLAVAEILADDGAIIYIDGVEVGRENVTGVDFYTLLANDAFNTENRTRKIPVGPLTAGDHTIAVSVHNSSLTSSDLGFDLRLLEAIPFAGNVVFTGTDLCTGFQDAAVGADEYVSGSNGDEIGWVSDSAVVIATGAEQAFEITQLADVRLETERIDVTGVSNLVASMDLRTIDTSSGLEVDDFLHVYVEGSFDGLSFQPVADIFSRLTGGTPDPFEIYRSDTTYTSFSTSVGDIPDGLVSARIVVEGSANSNSEHIIVDNLCLTTGEARIRITSFTATPANGVSITVESVPGNLYEVQASPDLGVTTAWIPAGSEVAENGTLTFDLPAPLPAAMMYYRVVDLGED